MVVAQSRRFRSSQRSKQQFEISDSSKQMECSLLSEKSISRHLALRNEALGSNLSTFPSGVCHRSNAFGSGNINPLKSVRPFLLGSERSAGDFPVNNRCHASFLCESLIMVAGGTWTGQLSSRFD